MISTFTVEIFPWPFSSSGESWGLILIFPHFLKNFLGCFHILKTDFKQRRVLGTEEKNHVKINREKDKGGKKVKKYKIGNNYSG